jgi:20S proteasome alpha/beta subunit
MNNKNVRYSKKNKLNLRDFYMTTILAINCNDGMVIASDSQVTMVDVKRSQEDKIYQTKINENVDVILAGSGKSAYISRFIDFFEEHREDREIKQPRDCADLCEDIIRLLRSDRYPDFDINIIICIRINRNQESHFGLYTLYPLGIAEKADNYDCIGSGSTIVEYILYRLWFKGIGTEQAKKIAIYAIDEVKKIDPYSGGFTRVTIIKKDEIKSMNIDEIMNEASLIQKRDFDLKTLWAKMVLFPSEWNEFLEEQKKKSNGQEKI